MENQAIAELECPLSKELCKVAERYVDDRGEDIKIGMNGLSALKLIC